MAYEANTTSNTNTIDRDRDSRRESTTGSSMGRRDSMTGSSINRSERDLQRDETTNLISSEKVEGTAVYNRDGEKLGSIKNFMVGKRNGRVEYAVMSFGGLLGMGERYHPLPWDVLDYDTDKGGYVVDIDKEQLKSGPSFERGREPTFDRQYGESVYGHYGRTY